MLKKNLNRNQTDLIYACIQGAWENEEWGLHDPRVRPVGEATQTGSQVRINDLVNNVLLSSTIDPMIEIMCLGQKKYCQCKQDVGPAQEIYWGEHHFFEAKKLVRVDCDVKREQEENDIEEGKIVIRILNKGYFKDDTVGHFELDITQIYFQKDHVLMHQWLALSNPENVNDQNEITAYLRVSIHISGPGDQQIALTDDTSLSTSDGDNVMMPASIKKNYKQLHFRVIRGEKLPKTDTFGSIDAYVMTQFNKQKLKTKTVTMKDKSVEWNQEFLLPLQFPSANDRLIFQLWDQN